MCQGASACLDQRVVAVDATDARTKCASASARWGLTAARPFLPVMMKTAAPLHDGLLIIHTGGVCSVMPSDSPHMSVRVDQPLAADSNEPVGRRGGHNESPASIIFT